MPRTAARWSILGFLIVTTLPTIEGWGQAREAPATTLTVTQAKTTDQGIEIELTAENQGDRSIALAEGDGPHLDDGFGTRFVPIAPEDDPELTISPGRRLTGTLRFVGRPHPLADQVTLAAAGGTLKAAPAKLLPPDDKTMIYRMAGRDGRLGTVEAGEGLRIQVDRIEPVAEGLRLVTTVENRSDRDLALNRDSRLRLEDGHGRELALVPPEGNQDLAIPKGGVLDGRLLFRGRPSPLADAVILVVERGPAPTLRIAMPLPQQGERVAPAAAGSTAGPLTLIVRDLRAEGDVILIPVLLVNRGRHQHHLELPGAVLADRDGRTYPMLPFRPATAPVVPARSLADALLTFAGPLGAGQERPDEGLRLTLRWVPDDTPSREPVEVAVTLPRPPVADGPRLPLSVLQAGKLDASAVTVSGPSPAESTARVTAGPGSTATIRRLKEDLGARETEAGTVISMSADVLFDFDSATIQNDARQFLDRLAQLIEETKPRRILIEGHSDAIGPDDYNLQLSQRRADAVADYLRKRNTLVAMEIIRVGHGEAKPIAPNRTAAGRDDADGRRRNRRVEITLGG